MNRTRLIIAGILVGLFALLAPLTLLTRQAAKSLFSPRAYKEVLARSGFYETTPAIIGNLLHDSLAIDESCSQNPYWCAETGVLNEAMHACLQENVSPEDYDELANDARPLTPEERAVANRCAEESGVDYAQLDAGLLSRLSAADWEVFLQATTPADIWQAVFENLIDQTFALLSGNQSQISLPLTPFQHALASPNATEAFLQIMESKPACSPGEALNWERYLNGNQDAPPRLCRLPVVLYPQAKAALGTSLQSYAQLLPDEVSLFTTPAGQNLPDQVWGIRFLMLASPALPLILLAVASLLTIKTSHDWLVWWGGAFFGAGLVGLLLGNSFLLRLNQVILNISRAAGEERIPPDLINGVVNAGLEIAQHLSSGLTQTSILLGMAGLGLLAASWFLQRNLAEKTLQ